MTGPVFRRPRSSETSARSEETGARSGETRAKGPQGPLPPRAPCAADVVRRQFWAETAALQALRRAGFILGSEIGLREQRGWAMPLSTMTIMVPNPPIRRKFLWLIPFTEEVPANIVGRIHLNRSGVGGVHPWPWRLELMGDADALRAESAIRAVAERWDMPLIVSSAGPEPGRELMAWEYHSPGRAPQG